MNNKKLEIKKHLLFTYEMLTPLGVIVFMFGILLMFDSFITNDSSNAIFGSVLLLFSYLLYEMNWKFDNLECILESKNIEQPKLNQRHKKK